MEEENGFQYFVNSTYKEDRIDRKTLIINIDDKNKFSGDWWMLWWLQETEVILEEPINIDKLSDII